MPGIPLLPAAAGRRCSRRHLIPAAPPAHWPAAPPPRTRPSRAAPRHWLRPAPPRHYWPVRTGNGRSARTRGRVWGNGQPGGARLAGSCRPAAEAFGAASRGAGHPHTARPEPAEAAPNAPRSMCHAINCNSHLGLNAFYHCSPSRANREHGQWKSSFIPCFFPFVVESTARVAVALHICCTPSAQVATTERQLRNN